MPEESSDDIFRNNLLDWLGCLGLMLIGSTAFVAFIYIIARYAQ